MSADTCELISDIFGYFVQLVLGAIAMSILIVKRYRESPRRDWYVFARDASKQVFGALMLHFLNMALSIWVTIASDDSECPWYFLNSLLDNLVGVLFNFLLLRLFKVVFAKSCPDIAISGRYSTRCAFISQLILWLSIVLLGKMVIYFGIVRTFTYDLGSIGTIIMSPLSDYPRFELIVVMIIIPFFLNAFQFWVTDNFLKMKGVDSVKSAPIYSPIGGAISSNSIKMDDLRADVVIEEKEESTSFLFASEANNAIEKDDIHHESLDIEESSFLIEEEADDEPD